VIAEIISIGTELLMGQVLDTNAQFLSRRLSALGVTHQRRSTVGDNPVRLKETYAAALGRADVLITSGGLGPTGDDITKSVLAELLEEPLVVREDALARLKERFSRMNRVMPESNIVQAAFTKDSIILPNENGTAPGAIVPCDRFGAGKIVIHLPGPPAELEAMFDASVAPYLQKRSGSALVSRYIRIFGMGESEAETRVKDLTQGSNPTLSPYCSPGEVMLRATALCSCPSEGAAMLAPLVSKVRDRLGDVVYAVEETDGGSLAKTVIALLIDKHQTLSVAESVTGGMLSSMLVSVPGASRVYAGGFITYMNERKEAFTGVRHETLTRYGAVSEPCAIQMAEGALLRAGTDIAVSVTGCAGPDSDERNTPVGQVFAGVAVRGRAYAKALRLTGSRQHIRALACLHALNLVRMELIKGDASALNE